MLSKKSLLLLAGASALWIVLLMWLLDSVSLSPTMEMLDPGTTAQTDPVNEFPANAGGIKTNSSPEVIAVSPAAAVSETVSDTPETPDNSRAESTVATVAVSTTTRSQPDAPLISEESVKPAAPATSVTDDIEATIKEKLTSVAEVPDTSEPDLEVPTDVTSESAPSVASSIEETIRKKLQSGTSANTAPAGSTENPEAMPLVVKPEAEPQPISAEQASNEIQPARNQSKAAQITAMVVTNEINTGSLAQTNKHKEVDDSSKLTTHDIASVDKALVDELMALGEAEYGVFCAACHGDDGKGLGAFPPIAGSPIATGDAGLHASVVLNGVEGTGMRAFADKLDDKSLAAVITFQRNAFGNKVGDVVTPEGIEGLR